MSASLRDVCVCGRQRGDHDETGRLGGCQFRLAFTCFFPAASVVRKPLPPIDRSTEVRGYIDVGAFQRRLEADLLREQDQAFLGFGYAGPRYAFTFPDPWRVRLRRRVDGGITRARRTVLGPVAVRLRELAERLDGERWEPPYW